MRQTLKKIGNMFLGCGDCQMRKDASENSAKMKEEDKAKIIGEKFQISKQLQIKFKSDINLPISDQNQDFQKQQLDDSNFFEFPNNIYQDEQSSNFQLFSETSTFQSNSICSQFQEKIQFSPVQNNEESLQIHNIQIQSQILNSFSSNEILAQSLKLQQEKQWTLEQDIKLSRLVYGSLKMINWKEISKQFEKKSYTDCKARWKKIKNLFQVKSSWSEHEDNQLLIIVQQIGEQNWNLIYQTYCNEKNYKTYRSLKQLQDRYFNFLHPCLNKSPFTEQEDQIIIEEFNMHGNKWKKIAKSLKNRSYQMVRNRFHQNIKHLIFSDNCNQGKKNKHKILKYSKTEKKQLIQQKQVEKNLNHVNRKLDFEENIINQNKINMQNNYQEICNFINNHNQNFLNQCDSFPSANDLSDQQTELQQDSNNNPALQDLLYYYNNLPDSQKNNFDYQQSPLFQSLSISEQIKFIKAKAKCIEQQMQGLWYSGIQAQFPLHDQLVLNGNQ